MAETIKKWILSIRFEYPRSIFDMSPADLEEMDEIGYEDYFYGDGICLVEWANLIEELMPENTIRITIEKDLECGFDFRRITVE